MAAKDVRFGDDVRQKMVKGVNTLANAVKVTSRAKRKECSPRKIFRCPNNYKRWSFSS